MGVRAVRALVLSFNHSQIMIEAKLKVRSGAWPMYHRAPVGAAPFAEGASVLLAFDLALAIDESPPALQHLAIEQLTTRSTSLCGGTASPADRPDHVQ
jgi:hypothetical protein